jgi:hypothetical protein
VIKRERVDEIGARWFKPRGGGNNHAPTYYFVIECVFEIVEDNREPSESSEDDNLVQNERKLRQKGKTRQFETTSIRPNAFGEWEVRREEGELNHIPRAIKTALLHYGWQIEE